MTVSRSLLRQHSCHCRRECNAHQKGLHRELESIWAYGAAAGMGVISGLHLIIGSTSPTLLQLLELLEGKNLPGALVAQNHNMHSD